ncbi:MAG: hypothetical protein U1F34_01550 [Gammaproteobacteria bacterium]
MARPITYDESRHLIKFLEVMKSGGSNPLSCHVLDSLVDKGWLQPNGLRLIATAVAREFMMQINRRDLL